jgi:uncharacterized membrane protein YdjX (TVP38/TMEM64 family)
VKAFVGPILGLLAVVALMLVWRYTPLAQLVELDLLVAKAHAVRQNFVLLLLAPFIFAGLALLLVPVTILRATTVIAFGPILGPIFAMVGGAIAAFVGFSAGQFLGTAALEKLAGGARMTRFRARLERGGVLAIAAMRMVPLGPFTFVNAACGAANLRRRDFMLGTTLVMIPGLVLMALAVSIFPGLGDTIFPTR